MITKNQIVEILPQWQDAGDSKYTWVALCDEENGTVDISPIDHPFTIKPVYTVRVSQIKAI